jgi:3-hydroxyisobutyrate dehydrogenase-like beta-hydroxyacid dehydrogenase
MNSESGIKVGFIGLGNMGLAMARCLPRNGLDLTVYDLNKEPLDKMIALGAKAAKSSREVAAVCDAVITMVRDIEQTDQVIFGKDGVWEGINEGSIIIISSSIGPKYCQDLYARAKKEKGVKVVDCAVSDPSNGTHYLEGQLTLMIGGDEEDVKMCWPIFDAMGKNIFHLGETGKGQAYKLINNMVSMHVGGVTNECINLGLKAGLDRDKMIEVMSVSTGGVWNFTNQVFMKKAGIKPRFMASAPAPSAAGGAPPPRRMSFEIQKAYELAEELGVPMPVCRFIQEHPGR